MDAIEGHGDVRRQVEEHQEHDARVSGLQAVVNGAPDITEGWVEDEFDGIRSELDFRRAMALQGASMDVDVDDRPATETWSQRALRALSVLRASLRNARTLRPLR